MTQAPDIQALSGESMNLAEHNIEQLKQLFPNVFTEGKIDFEALKSELGEFTETDNERYQFTWNGKEQAKRIATTPTLGTLRPAPEESVNWDTTENIYIEGDNLEVLKLLQKSYFGKVKMIYIDPPYNTGKDFVYKDDFKDNLANYQRLTGQKDEAGNPLNTNADSSGRYHSNWLNMMYPRLKLARNLLFDDGIIFISIDDNEVNNLRKICDEIFGEDNFVANFIWKGGRRNAAKYISTSHEYILMYCKDLSSIELSGKMWKERKKGIEEVYLKYDFLLKKHKQDHKKISEEIQSWYSSLTDDHSAKSISHYCWSDKNGLYFASDISRGGGGGPIWPINNPLTGEAVSIPQRGWAYSQLDDLQNDVKNNLIHFNGSNVPCKKRYLKANEFQLIETVFYKDRRGSSKRLRQMMNGNYFDFPKDEIVLKKLVESFTEKKSIILDFFSGSATTAHAVMQLNAQDKGERKFILVQIPEPTSEKSEAKKAGFESIVEIGKERMQRAAKKIKEEHPETQADLGFKTFKLDTSNIKKWQPNLEELETDLLSVVDNILPDRTSQDLLFEVLIKYGLPLTLPVEEINIQNNGQTYQAWNVANNALIACFDENLTLEAVQAIAALSTSENPVLRVVFRDTSFQNDITKTNAIQRLKQAGIEDVLSI